MTYELGLGRLIAKDPQDANYPMRAVLPEASERTSRYWFANAGWLDQGQTPQCVVYSWEHYLLSGPLVQVPPFSPTALYEEAQKNDEWPGENYEGTSVRAGAKVLANNGLIGEYHWGSTLDDVVLAVLEHGPVVMGTNWYDDMFEPDSKGLVTVSGDLAGGHAWLIDGANKKTRIARAKNSWGRTWGKKGHFYIRFDDLAKLLAEDGAEAAIATEIRKA